MGEGRGKKLGGRFPQKEPSSFTLQEIAFL